MTLLGKADNQDPFYPPVSALSGLSLKFTGTCKLLLWPKLGASLSSPPYPSQQYPIVNFNALFNINSKSIRHCLNITPAQAPHYNHISEYEQPCSPQDSAKDLQLHQML